MQIFFLVVNHFNIDMRIDCFTSRRTLSLDNVKLKVGLRKLHRLAWILKIWIIASVLYTNVANINETDQYAWVRKLSYVSVVCICHNRGFRESWLKKCKG